MEIPFSPETQAQLSHLAQERGSDLGHLVRDLVERSLAQELRFIEAVREGNAALDRGERIALEDLGENFERLFRS